MAAIPCASSAATCAGSSENVSIAVSPFFVGTCLWHVELRWFTDYWFTDYWYTPDLHAEGMSLQLDRCHFLSVTNKSEPFRLDAKKTACRKMIRDTLLCLLCFSLRWNMVGGCWGVRLYASLLPRFLVLVLALTDDVLSRSFSSLRSISVRLRSMTLYCR